MTQEDKIQVVVLYGGRSTEHEVSCRSAAFVLRNLDPKRYDVHAIGIDKDGAWWPQDTPRLLEGLAVTVPIERGLKSLPPAALDGLVQARVGGTASPERTKKLLRERTVVFPVLHGTFGEDGTMQGLLELADVAFVGPDTLGSAVGMDKVVSKKLAVAAGVPVVPWIDFRQGAWRARRKELLAECIDKLGFPMFVKPARLGSSVGVSKAKNPEGLAAAIDEAFRYDDKLLIEKGVAAREIECAALGGYEPKISVPGEIVPHAEFYSYEAKYEDAAAADIVVPADLSPEQARTVQELTRKVFVALDLFGMARVDFFLDKTDGAFYFNEVNTIPGFTSISQYPMLWNASGIPAQELVETLVNAALERQNTKRSLIRSR